MNSVAALQQYSSYPTNSGAGSAADTSDGQFQEILNESVNNAKSTDKTAGDHDGKQPGKSDGASEKVNGDKTQDSEAQSPEDAAKAALNMLLSNGIFQNLLVQAQPEETIRKIMEGTTADSTGQDGQSELEAAAPATVIAAGEELAAVQEPQDGAKAQQTDALAAKKQADTVLTEADTTLQQQTQDIPTGTENGSLLQSAVGEQAPVQAKAAEEATAARPEIVNAGGKTEETQKSQETSKDATALAAAAVQTTAKEAPAATETVQTAAPAEQANTAQKLQVKTPEELPEKLAENLQEALRTGKQELTLKLQPQHLGELTIKASYENGRAVVSIACTSEKTMEILASRATDMANIMENNLGTPTNIVLDKSETDYLKQQNENGKSKRDGREGQNEQQNSRNKEQESVDFLQQLRLGIV